MSGKLKGLVLAVMLIAITLGAYAARADTSITFTSLTHPDETKWYKADKYGKTTCRLTWFVDGATDYSFELDQNKNTIPDETVDVSPGAWDLPDGINYFHVRARFIDGSWSDTANYTVKVDTVAPVIKSVEIDGGAVKCYSLNVGISIDAYDDLSGIESVRVATPSFADETAGPQPYHYYIAAKLTEPSPNNPGTTYRRYAYVVAIDAAGNSTPLNAHSDYIDYENPCPT